MDTYWYCTEHNKATRGQGDERHCPTGSVRGRLAWLPEKAAAEEYDWDAHRYPRVPLLPS